MPLPEYSLTREQALNAILSSITMEETALGNIMNAESEIIQFAMNYIKCNGCDDADVQTVSEVSENVSALLEQVSDMQTILKNKLRLAVNNIPVQPDPLPRPEYPPENAHTGYPDPLLCPNQCEQPCEPPYPKFNRRPGKQLILARQFYHR